MEKAWSYWFRKLWINDQNLEFIEKINLKDWRGGLQRKASQWKGEGFKEFEGWNEEKTRIGGGENDSNLWGKFKIERLINDSHAIRIKYVSISYQWIQTWN